ncbi:MAG: acyl-CoA dehydrogenase family protein [Deltaproteobacteria bacterium]
MDLELSEVQTRVRETARRIAETELLPRAKEADRNAKFPADQIRALAKEGFLAMLVPEAFGGTDLGSVCYSLAMTEIARACASTAVTMAVTNMVGDAICAWGNDAQKKKYVPRLARAELLAGSFALSEPGAGSDAAALQASAVLDGDHYRLNGSKCWITSGDVAGVILVMAKTDPAAGARGISTFLVEPSMPGFSVGRHEEKMGIRGSSTVTINLDDVRVPVENRLGEEGVGFKVAMRALDGGRIGIGSQALGMGRAALETATEYVRGNEGLAKKQSIQWKLADTATELDAARMLVLRAATMKDASIPFSKEASMAKVYATEAANRATHAAVEICGGAALSDDLPLERYLRDVRVTTIYEGTSEIQRFVIARQLLAEA